MWQTHEQQADSWTNLKGKHVQGPGATSLYPANIGHGGAMGQRKEVKGGVVWWWGEGKRSIHGSCPSLFWEVRPAGMIDHPKEAI